MQPNAVPSSRKRHGRKATPVPAADEEAQPARGNIVELKKVPAKEAA